MSQNKKWCLCKSFNSNWSIEKLNVISGVIEPNNYNLVVSCEDLNQAQTLLKELNDKSRSCGNSRCCKRRNYS